MAGTPKAKSPQAGNIGLSASVQVLPLPPGLYLFSVKSATPSRISAAASLTLPAVHVGLGPGVQSDHVEFVGGPTTHGGWLFAIGDQLVARIRGTGVALMLTSVRAPGGELLAISVDRLDSRTATATPDAPAASNRLERSVDPASSSARSADPSVASDGSVVPLLITVHVRTRGDMPFQDVSWAGRVAPGLWIESFTLRPLSKLRATDVEYKGLTGSGFETPWISEEKSCGTKGLSVPLVGFAIRLKPGPATIGYHCEYSGYFKSGVIVGPIRNGAPCRSTVANDPLEGIQVRIIRRAGAGARRSPAPGRAVSRKIPAKKSSRPTRQKHRRSS